MLGVDLVKVQKYTTLVYGRCNSLLVHTPVTNMLKNSGGKHQQDMLAGAVGNHICPPLKDTGTNKCVQIAKHRNHSGFLPFLINKQCLLPP